MLIFKTKVQELGNKIIKSKLQCLLKNNIRITSKTVKVHFNSNVLLKGHTKEHKVANTELVSDLGRILLKLQHSLLKSRILCPIAFTPQNEVLEHMLNNCSDFYLPL